MILSLDSACAKTGWAILENDQTIVDYGLIKYTNSNKGKVLLNAYKSITEILNKYPNIKYVIFEDQHNQFFKTFKALVEFRGALLLAIYLFNNKIEVSYQVPSHIRKVVLDNGNADKEEVCEFVSQKYNIDFFNLKENFGRDITDAIVIGLSYLIEGKKTVNDRDTRSNRKKTKNTRNNKKRIIKSESSWD